jgi:pyruvate dehydrogenase E1 component
MLHPGKPPREAYVTRCLAGRGGVTVAVSDYVKALPDSLARWVPGPFVSLGTDGFGRSDSRAALRNFFEVDARYMVIGALTALAREGVVSASVAEEAIRDFEVDPEKVNPLIR